jgi:hypothetical protein
LAQAGGFARPIVVRAFVAALVASAALGAGVAHAATLSVTTSSLPVARQLTAYSATVAASGGAAPYHWSLSGTPPAGLSLSAAGVLTGMPTSAGTSNVTVNVTDSATPTAASATRSLPLTVLAPLNQSIVYALNAENSTVTEYAPGASGAAAPTVKIAGSNTQIGFDPQGLAVSPARKVYVSGRTANGVGAIFEFASDANGNAAPQTVISGSATGLNGNAGVALDKAGNIWVANAGNATITEYAAASGGNAAPRLTLGGSATGLNHPARLAFDAGGNLWVTNSLPQNSTVTEYPAASLQQTSSQAVNLAPIATLASTRTEGASGTVFDPLGALHVQDAANRALVGFAPGAPNGNPTPAEVLAGSNTQLGGGYGVAADPAGRLYVAAGVVVEFNYNSTGNVAPVATLTAGVDGVVDVAVSPPAPVAYAGVTPLRPTVGAPFSYTLTGGGGVAPYHFAVSSGTLPAGMSLTSGGVLSGVPTTAGTSTIMIRITDSALPTAASATQTLQLIVTQPPALAVSTASLPSTAVGQRYTTSVTAAGGVAPYSWAITGGSLPAGLKLSTSGSITGVPTQMGTFTFTVAATDSAAPTHHTASRTLTLTVKVAPGVYAANAGNDSVTEYPVGQGGDINPIADLTGPDTGLSTPESVVLDATGDVFVANEGNDTVTEYAPGASGDARPTRTISGVSSPCRLALNGSGDLYVASLFGPIYEYSVGSGTPALVATITGQNQPRGLAVDASGNLWVSESVVNIVNEFSPRASGAPTPIASISGPDTGLTSPQGLVFDASGNLTVADAGTNGSDGSVTVYPVAHLSGDSVPTQRITSGVAEPLGVDRGTDNTLFVADVGNNSVVAYAPGSTTPTAVISGPTFTQLNVPVGVAATPPLSISTRSLPRARRGRRYLVNLVAAEGTTPYRWRLARGRLPRRLRITRAGAIIGTPSGPPGIYRITVRVSDSTHPSQTVTQKLTLRLEPQRRGRTGHHRPKGHRLHERHRRHKGNRPHGGHRRRR